MRPWGNAAVPPYRRRAPLRCMQDFLDLPVRGRCQSPGKIAFQIVLTLEADGEPQQAIVDPSGATRLGAHPWRASSSPDGRPGFPLHRGFGEREAPRPTSESRPHRLDTTATQNSAWHRSRTAASSRSHARGAWTGRGNARPPRTDAQPSGDWAAVCSLALDTREQRAQAPQGEDSSKGARSRP